ncbi:hypothetical protein BC829DRAFT_64553 [Chytridium lagenaria]|nr:hypothetical protein BC829DRAFT_64553 [Chytridium lagenaria]
MATAVPSVLQIRAPGVKGVLVVDPILSRKHTILMRKSMQKLVILDPRLSLESYDYSSPARGAPVDNAIATEMMRRFQAEKLKPAIKVQSCIWPL